jgi:hypothetical protein
MRIGAALMEETQFDERNGRVMNRSLAEYHMPVHADVPEIDVMWTDIPDPHNPMGAHGVGEIGVTAEVANAIYNATGTRVHDLPMTLDKLERSGGRPDGSHFRPILGRDARGRLSEIRATTLVPPGVAWTKVRRHVLGTGQTEQVKLYGRDEVLARIAVPGNASVIIVTGDAGSGKSAVLGRAAEMDMERGLVAPSPERLSRAGGSLQRALLGQLAIAVGALVTDHGMASRVAATIAAAGRQIRADKGHELAVVLGRELLALARAKIGADAGAALAEYVQAQASDSEYALRARIQAADSDVLATLTVFIGEVATLAGRPVVLAVDNVERLGEEDIRQLADLAERLPREAVVRGAWSVTRAAAGQVRMLLEAGALLAELPPLSNAAVGEWLADEGLDPGLAPAVQRVSGGYGLFADNAIGLLRDGGSLSDVSADELFEHSTIDALRALDTDIAVAARRLAAYADPPPSERIAELAGVSPESWGEMAARLQHSRIFTMSPGGQPWFHELRRRVVWAQVDAPAREEAANAAVADLSQRYESTGAPELLVTLAQIAPDSPLVTSQPMQKAALDASADEIAVAAAVIELSEPGGPAGGRQPLLHVIGDSLLMYARDVFGRPGADLVAALTRLRERGLLAVAGPADSPLVVPVFDAGSLRLLAGRAGAELRRVPVMRLATSAVFAAITPRLGKVEQLRYGLGSPAVSQLARDAVRSGMPAGRPRRSGGQPIVIVRALAVGEPLFACVTFADDHARDDTLAQLRPGTREPLLGSEVLVSDVLALPVTRIPTERLLQAAGRLLDEPLNRITAKVPTPRPVNPLEAARGRAETLRLVRAISSRVERYALELEGHIQVAYAGNERNMQLVDIHGSEDGIRALPGLTQMWDRPYARFQFTETVGLRRGESLGHITGRASQRPIQDDPVIETLSALRQRAIRFNQTQVRKDVLLEETALRNLLQEAANAQFEAAKTMHAALPFAVGVHYPVPTRTIIVICPDLPPHDGFRSPPLASVMTLDAEDTAREDLVEIALTAPMTTPDNAAIDIVLKNRFGIDASHPHLGLRHGYDSDAYHALADLLGYRNNDIRLIYGE